MSFDIGNTDGIAIFTSNSNDVFGNFSIDQGNTGEIFDLGKTSGMDDIKIEQMERNVSHSSNSSGSTFDADKRKKPNFENIKNTRDEFVPKNKKPDFGFVPKEDVKPPSPPPSPPQELKKPEFKQPEFKQPEFKQPEFKKPEFNRPPEIRKPRDKIDSFKFDEADIKKPEFKKYDSFSQSSVSSVKSDPKGTFKFDDLLNVKKPKSVDGDSVLSGESRSTIRPPSRAPREFPRDTSRDAPRDAPREFQREPMREPSSSGYINEEDEKIDLLLKLKSLESRQGITLSKVLGPKSSIEDIRIEYKNQMNNIQMESSIKIMRHGLMFFTYGIEQMNEKWGAGIANLNGWSDNISGSINEYDNIFERLYYKYSNNMGQMDPLVELIFSLAASAFFYHASASFAKTTAPAFKNMMKDNPNMLNQFMNSIKTSVEPKKQVPMPSNSQGADDGVNLSELFQRMGATENGFGNFMNHPQSTREFTEKQQKETISNMYRKMIDADNISVNSNSSEKSIGHGKDKATIMSVEDKKGQKSNVIRL